MRIPKELSFNGWSVVRGDRWFADIFQEVEDVKIIVGASTNEPREYWLRMWDKDQTVLLFEVWKESVWECVEAINEFLAKPRED